MLNNNGRKTPIIVRFFLTFILECIMIVFSSSSSHLLCYILQKQITYLCVLMFCVSNPVEHHLGVVFLFFLRFLFLFFSVCDSVKCT